MNKLEIVGDTEKVPSHERAAAELEVAKTFVDHGPGKPFTFRESGEDAFTDNGDGTFTSDNDSRAVAEAMVKLTLSKGAVKFKPQGSDEFMENTEFAMGQIQVDYERKIEAEDARQAAAEVSTSNDTRSPLEPEQAQVPQHPSMTDEQAQQMADLVGAKNYDGWASEYDEMGKPGKANELRTEPVQLRGEEKKGGKTISEKAAELLAQRESAQPKKPIVFKSVENDSMVPLSTGKYEIAPENTVDATETKAADDEKEIKRRNALAKRVVDRYTVNGKHYLVPGADKQEAFIDNGKQFKVKLDDERTVRDVVDLLASRGAQSLKVSGTAVLARNTWIAAQRHGMEVTGYKPTAQDIALYQKLKAENTITDITTQQHAKAPEQAATASETTASKATAPGVRSGKLIEHGEAPYQHNPKSNKSYYLMLESNGEVVTQWGVDLKSAIAKSGVQLEDNITLRKTEVKDVLVEDEEGIEVQGRRATWVIDSPERNELNKAAALRAAAVAVSTKFSEPADRELMVKGMDERIAQQQAEQKLLPEVMIRKQVRQDVPVQHEKESEQQTY